MPTLGRLGDSRCALTSTGATQVAHYWCFRVIILGGPSGDLQLVTLVALIALARTYDAAFRTFVREGWWCIVLRLRLKGKVGSSDVLE